MTHRDLIGDGNLRSWTLLWQWSFKVSMLCFCRPSQAVVSTIVPGEWLNRVATVPPSTLLLRFGRHFRDTKAWILQCVPSIGRPVFLHFPWTPSKLLVLFIDSWTDVAETTSRWQAAGSILGEVGHQNYSPGAARGRLRPVKRHELVLGGMFLGNRVIS